MSTPPLPSNAPGEELLPGTWAACIHSRPVHFFAQDQAAPLCGRPLVRVPFGDRSADVPLSACCQACAGRWTTTIQQRHLERVAAERAGKP